MLLTLRGRHRADTTRLGRRFTVLWVGQAVSQLGDKMAYISIPLFVVFLTTDSRDLGITYALDSAPALLLGLVGGIFLDRVRIRLLMVFSDLARAAAFLYLASVASQPDVGGRGALVAVFLMAFVVGSFTTLYDNAMFTLIPSLVKPSDLALANGRVNATANLGSALGPPLAGVLVGWTDTFTLVFIIDAATFVASAAAVALIGRVPRPPSEEAPSGVWADLLRGLRFVWAESRLRVSTIAVAVVNLVMGFIEATFVIIAADVVLATEEWQLGVVFAVFSAGGMVGSLLAPTASRRVGLGRTMTIGMMVIALGFTLFVNTRFGVLGLVYLFVSFMGVAALNVAVATIRQSYSPPVMLGRVITAARAIGWATLPLGALLGTFIAEATGRFEVMARLSPVIILGVAVALLPTIIWSDTFGPVPERHRARFEVLPDEA